MNLTAWRLFLGNLLEHILYIMEMAKEFEEYHHILFDCFQSMLIDWLCVANEYVGRLGRFFVGEREREKEHRHLHSLFSRSILHQTSLNTHLGEIRFGSDGDLCR